MSELLVGKSPDGDVTLRLDRANRHGVIAGATGTGKTVTLQTLAEGFSNAGVPVFAADIKGDLSGLAMPGQPSEKLIARVAANGFTIEPAASPAIFWDLLGAKGHPVRTTLSEIGPVMLARLLELSDAQEGVLTIAFEVADDEGLALLDLDDLQAVLKLLAEEDKKYSAEYGNITDASVSTIQRKLLTLRNQDADKFFGEPALDISDLMRTSGERGVVSLLDATRLIEQPRLYSTFLLWLMSELFEELPEVGDPEKPKLVFFFDEAHLLFRDAPRALLEKIEQVVRLIRSKGVGVYFITQNPADIPDSVLAQLGNRIQHALRAYTPREQKAVKTAADTFRPNPDFDCAAAITQLGTGEALVSTLEEKGIPSMVQRTLIRPPSSRLGPITPEERKKIMAESPVAGEYDQTVDRESAFEMLQKKAERAQQADAETRGGSEGGQGGGRWTLPDFGSGGGNRRDDDDYRPRQQQRPAPRPRTSNRQTVTEAAIKSVVRSVGSSVGRAIVRGILGSLSRR